MKDCLFTEAQLLDEILQRVSMLILAKDHPRGIANHSVTQAIHRWRKGNRFSSSEDIEKSLRNIFVPILKQYQPKLDEIEKDWQSFYRRVRVLNGLPKIDDPTCWRQYALFHRGIALKFNCDAGDDEHEIFNVAKPIEYTNERMGITSLLGQVNNVIGQHDIRAQEQFLELMARKPLAQNFEQEIRFFHVLEENVVSADAKPETWLTELPFTEHDLTSVTLGLKTPKKERVAVLKQVKASFPHTSVYKARYAENSYELEFEMIHEGQKPEED